MLQTCSFNYCLIISGLQTKRLTALRNQTKANKRNWNISYVGWSWYNNFSWNWNAVWNKWILALIKQQRERPEKFRTERGFEPWGLQCRCSTKGRLHDRAKMARIRQKLERFQQFLQRNSELLSVPCRVHRRLRTRCGTDKSSLFLCKNCWNRSSFCRIRAIFALSCKRPLASWAIWPTGSWA